eukprot:gene5704-7098_t
MTQENNGLVVGFYEGSSSTEIEFSALGKKLNQDSNDSIAKTLKLSENKGKVGDALVLYNVLPDVPRLAVVGLGKKPTNDTNLFDKNENIRKASGAGVKALKAKGAQNITIDSSIGCNKILSEGAHLSTFKFDLKTKVGQKSSESSEESPEEKTVDIKATTEGANQSAWEEGKVVAAAQNFARVLMETPANLMTPTLFCQKVSEQLKSLIDSGKVEMVVRDVEWVKAQKMGLFYSVAQGSDEPLKFLELHYKGAGEGKQPVVFVGKGVTFDSGGISIKPAPGMALMKGDMGGAATTVSAFYGIATIGVPINLTTLTPLTENMPNGRATKPGDVHYGMNGKSVEVDNTDAEGRLILADALHYAHSFNPSTIIDVATLTGAIDVALGSHAAGVFSTSDELWDDINQSGTTTGERMWRMPLFPEYRKQIDSKVADLINTGGRSGGSCTAAMFLKEFVQINRWAHLDIAGVMSSSEDSPYLKKGMTGKPVRTLIELSKKLSSK